MALTPLVGDLVEVQSELLGIFGLYIVRSVVSGGLTVSTPAEPHHVVHIQSSDVLHTWSGQANPTPTAHLVVNDVTVVAPGGPYTQDPSTVNGASASFSGLIVPRGGIASSSYDQYATKGTEALPATSDSGDTWTLVKTAAVSDAGLTIISGKLTNATAFNGGAAGYAEWNKAGCNRMGADITFSAGTTTGCAALACWKTQLLASTSIPDTGWHLVFTPTFYNLSYFVAGVNTSVSGNVFYATALTQDGTTTYRVEITVVGTTAYILLPDGTIVSYTDSHNAAADWPTFEVFQNNASTETKAAFVNVWAEAPLSDLRPYASMTDLLRTAGLVQASLQTDQSQFLPVAGNFTAWTGQVSATLGVVAVDYECYLFASGADNYLITTRRFPSSWKRLQIIYWWANNGAGSGNVRWNYEVKTNAAGATLSGGFASHSTVLAASAQNVLVSTDVTAASGTEALTAGAPTTIIIRRNAADVSDTLGNNIALIAVEFIKALV